MSLVKAAARLQKRHGPFNVVWVVFDKDDFPPQQFNEAVRQAHTAGFEVAWSNQSFELWYLLHFQYLDAALDRGQYLKRLETCLEGGYRKNDPDVYDKLLARQGDAIRNAKKLAISYGEHALPGSSDPCTEVHKLVADLNAHLQT